MSEQIDALRESEERLRQLSENIDDVLWLTDARQQQVLYVNPGYEVVFGGIREELYREPLSWLRHVHPEDHARVQAALRTQPEGRFDEQFRIWRPDGAVCWVRHRMAPVRDASGEVVRLAGMTQDITRLVEVEQELREGEAHYRRLVETSPYAIYALDSVGHFTEVNPATLNITGHSAGELLGAHFSEIIHPEDMSVAGGAFDDLMTGGRTRVDIDVRVVHPVAGPRWLSIAVAMVADAAGNPAGVHGIARDVTEEKTREQHLRRAERFATMGTLIGGVAHELNNPLQAIAGFAELLLDGEPSDEEQGAALETISREARRASRIVTDLRLLARQAHEESVRLEAVDVNDVVRHVLRTREYALSTGGIELKLGLAPALPTVLGDPERLEQAVLNLVVNAEQALAEATGPRRLVIATRAAVNGVCVTVQDSGPGITRDALPHLFDPFWTTKAPGEGVGLGLSIVHGIVQEHHGTVHVESEPGRGARFQVELPAVSEGMPHPDSTAGGEAARLAPDNPGSTLRILVVDDEPAIRRLVSRVAQRRGHHADEAGEGSEALLLIEQAAAAGCQYDLVLSDLRMPGVSGEQLIRVLLERDPSYRGRIVLITGDTVGAAASRLLEDGSVLVLAKPMGVSQLVDVMIRAEETPRRCEGE
jgi:PAS domain S-box-containing protein